MNPNTKRTPIIHDVKLSMEFCDDVNSGKKSFEIRLNDRDYRVGDYIRFDPYDPVKDEIVSHPVEEKIFLITYALEGWGLLENYVGLAIEEINLEVNSGSFLEIIKNDLEIFSKSFINDSSKNLNDAMCAITSAIQGMQKYLNLTYRAVTTETGEVLKQEK